MQEFIVYKTITNEYLFQLFVISITSYLFPLNDKTIVISSSHIICKRHKHQLHPFYINISQLV